MTEGERIVHIIVVALLLISFVCVVWKFVLDVISSIDEREMQMQDEQQCGNRTDAHSTREKNFKNDRTEVGEYKDLGAWIPLEKAQKNWLITCCAEYGTDICLALAVMEIESDFDAEAVGAAGEVGMFQLLPGRNDAIFKQLESFTNYDPRTEAGNIACGCWLLADLMLEYGDIEKAAYYADKNSSRESESVRYTPAYRSRKRNEQRLKSSGRWGK